MMARDHERKDALRDESMPETQSDGDNFHVSILGLRVLLNKQGGGTLSILFEFSVEFC